MCRWLPDSDAKPWKNESVLEERKRTDVKMKEGTNGMKQGKRDKIKLGIRYKQGK